MNNTKPQNSSNDSKAGSKIAAATIPVLSDIENALVKTNESLPKLPKSIVDLIVLVSPYLIIISAVIQAFTIITLLTAKNSLMGLNMMGVNYNSYYNRNIMLNVAFLAVVSVLYVLAFKPLLAKSKKGWDLIYYSVIVSIVGYLITGQVLSLILTAAISFYILFQIRPEYK